MLARRFIALRCAASRTLTALARTSWRTVLHGVAHHVGPPAESWPGYVPPEPEPTIVSHMQARMTAHDALIDQQARERDEAAARYEREAPAMLASIARHEAEAAAHRAELAATAAAEAEQALIAAALNTRSAFDTRNFSH